MKKAAAAIALLTPLATTASSISSFDVEQWGRTQAQLTLCVDEMPSRHDWRLNRKLEDLLSDVEEVRAENPKHEEDFKKYYKDETSDFRKLSNDETESECRSLVGMEE